MRRPLQTIARLLAHSLLRRISSGTLVVEDGSRAVFGQGEPVASVQVRSPAAWSLLLRGSRGLAEGYAEALWDSEDPTAVVRVAARNVHRIDAARRRLRPVLRPAQELGALSRRSTRRRSRRDVAAHYDLGNELFEAMLDETMTYSCAFFERPAMTLRQASVAKMRRVCEALRLQRGHRVLEIGGGWGGFALHAAREHGCHVTTTTISRQQYELAIRRVSDAGLSDLVTVLCRDYRDLEGEYDRLVSIEMIEAVGWRGYGRFFRRCAQLLRPEGAMLLQAIAIGDGAYEVQKAARSFISTCIFPNGCLPSLPALQRAIAQHTDLSILATAEIGAHYVETLRRWRERLQASGERLEELGYDERFRRLWSFYLSYCQAGFAERRIFDYQLLIGRPSAAWAAAEHPRGDRVQQRGRPMGGEHRPGGAAAGADAGAALLDR